MQAQAGVTAFLLFRSKNRGEREETWVKQLRAATKSLRASFVHSCSFLHSIYSRKLREPMWAGTMNFEWSPPMIRFHFSYAPVS